MQNDSIEAVGANGFVVRVEFIGHGDRIGHRILVVDSAGTVTLLMESVEGTPADDWPPSPPLQNLSIETLTNGRRAALLVGMAGRSHWSASIEAMPGSAQIVFDLACRHAQQPQALGSRYRLLAGAEGRILIEPRNSRLLRDAASDELAIEPQDVTRNVQTARWAYSVRPAGD